jgi:arylformamidase
MIHPGSIIDLSHSLVPENEEYGCELTVKNVEDVFPQYKRAPDAWYVIGKVEMNTHCGTHIEAPYHHARDGLDIASLPMDRLVGPAACFDFSDYGNNDEIRAEELVSRCGSLRVGDAVIFDCGVAGSYGTEKGHDRPWFDPEGIRWLVEEKKVWSVGTDATGVEVRTASGGSTGRQPNHEYLLGNGVPLIESLTNLGQLHGRRFTLMVLPVKIRGADAFPARVIAIKETE